MTRMGITGVRQDIAYGSGHLSNDHGIAQRRGRTDFLADLTAERL